MTDMNAWFDAEFQGIPVMAILRALGTERSVQIAEEAWRLGIRSVEVTVQSDDDLDALRAVVRAGEERGVAVGAGTIVTPEQVQIAKDAGAAFLVSPGFDRAVVEASHSAGVPILPGVATATEIQQATSMGLRWVKAFPAAVLGPAWFTAMRGPFPEVNFIATGGVTVGNAGALLDAGVRVVALGSALADPTQLPAVVSLLRGGDDAA